MLELYEMGIGWLNSSQDEGFEFSFIASAS